MIPCLGCHRHIRDDEARCPFCGAEMGAALPPLRAQLRAFVVMAAVALGSSGCGTDSSGEASEGNTTTTTATATATATDTTTQGSSESEGEGVETDESPDTSGSFYAVPQDVNGVSECDPLFQDCPIGEKCVPYSVGGETWDANKCVPIMGDGQAGESCTSGGLVEATDNCNGETFCWDVEDGVGECTPFCAGSIDDPSCDAGRACLIANDNSITLCVPTCDPLLQECPDPEVCSWAGFAFTCSEPSQEPGAIGQPCDVIADCNPGALCLSADVLPGCEASVCCAELCDTSQMDYPCIEPGLECLPFFEDPPEGYENIGVCIDPGP